MQRLSIELVNWSDHAPLLRAVRAQVFVHEQRVPEELEWDGWDELAEHALARIDAEVVGTARLLLEDAAAERVGRLGRMAVLGAWRRRGVGAAMLARLIERARELRLSALYLHAQTHAVAFYARHGFVPEGEPFSEVDIPHQGMRLRLP